MVGILLSISFLWGIIGLVSGGIGGYYFAIYVLFPIIKRHFSEGSFVGFDPGKIALGLIALGFGVSGGAIIGLTIALLFTK